MPRGSLKHHTSDSSINLTPIFPAGIGDLFLQLGLRVEQICTPIVDSKKTAEKLHRLRLLRDELKVHIGAAREEQDNLTLINRALLAVTIVHTVADIAMSQAFGKTGAVGVGINTVYGAAKTAAVAAAKGTRGKSMAFDAVKSSTDTKIGALEGHLKRTGKSGKFAKGLKAASTASLLFDFYGHAEAINEAIRGLDSGSGIESAGQTLRR